MTNGIMKNQTKHYSVFSERRLEMKSPKRIFSWGFLRFIG
jgi:hypothetical protein